MSRFNHLEIGNTEPLHPDDDLDGERVIDQHYYLDKADQAFADGRYERALSAYSRALEYDINLEEAWVGQLRCLIEIQELQEAIIWSDRALERLPNSAQVLAARAIAESRLGNTTSAMGFVDAAFATKGVTPLIWIARGEALIPMNALNAKACFSKAVEMAPSSWAVKAWIGRSYMAYNCYHQALEYLRTAVQMEPDRFICWYWIGKCCEALGEAGEAKRSYRRALAACPTFVPARNALVQLERRGLMSKITDGFRRLFGLKKVVED